MRHCLLPVCSRKGKGNHLQFVLDDWRTICSAVEEGCISCGLCHKECKYLQRYGFPIEQAKRALDGKLDPEQIFSCSLCGLCTAVCPQAIDPAGQFAALRRKVVADNQQTFKEHNPLTSYEKWGGSSTFSMYDLPEGCDTVFFPGCALSGTRPRRVEQVVEVLRKNIANLGVVLDCCTKPSHDLGRMDYFARSFTRINETLSKVGRKKGTGGLPQLFQDV